MSGLNLLGYLPLGLLFVRGADAQRRARWALACCWPCCGPALLSLLLEGLQSYLPRACPRGSDLLLNAAGGSLGALLACCSSAGRADQRWNRFRAHWLGHEPRRRAGAAGCCGRWRCCIRRPCPTAWARSCLGARPVRPRDLAAGHAVRAMAAGPGRCPGAEPPGAGAGGRAGPVGALACWAWPQPAAAAAAPVADPGLRALIAPAGSALSAALNYGPSHAWDGFSRRSACAAGAGQRCCGAGWPACCHAVPARVLLLLALGLAPGPAQPAPTRVPTSRLRLGAW